MFRLTSTDKVAIDDLDNNYINNIGAKHYAAGEYEKAIEYYRLGAAMGNVNSISNLGYCYMYARSIPQNMELAISYFKIAAQQLNIDALYKLGNIYKHGYEGVEPDEELAVYYYQRAIKAVQYNEEEYSSYPSLSFCMAKELMPGGALATDLEAAYKGLFYAKEGYELEKAEGITFHLSALDSVNELLNDPCFDRFKEDDEDSSDIPKIVFEAPNPV